MNKPETMSNKIEVKCDIESQLSPKKGQAP